MQERAREFTERFSDPFWRLSNLYWIVNEKGERVLFQPNEAQLYLYRNMWWRNLILKARQLGFTTFIQVFMLDACVFNSNTRAGVIAHNKDDAKAFFADKVKYPYDNLPEAIRAWNPARTDSANELAFRNNSSLRVGTSLRSGTFNLVHISEYGKLCAKYPEKAREVRTGALNTLHEGGIAFIESTAEGQEGDFYEKSQEAQELQRRKADLTRLDYRFFFFPWWKHPGYTLDSEVVVSDTDKAYFERLESRGISLTEGQRAWYVKKAREQGPDMKREHPSTPEEAFEASIEGAYYATQFQAVDHEGRICRLAHEPGVPVDTWWDIGVGDPTSIWFVQLIGRNIHVIDHYHNSGEGIEHYINVLDKKREQRGFKYGDHWGPHDIKVREWGTGRSRAETAKRLGVRFKVAPNLSIDDGIQAVRLLFPRMIFDEEHTAEGVRSLRNYRKEWDENLGTWKDKPRHDWSSHDADGFRIGCVAVRDRYAVPKPRFERTFNELLAEHDQAFTEERI